MHTKTHMVHHTVHSPNDQPIIDVQRPIHHATALHTVVNLLKAVKQQQEQGFLHEAHFLQNLLHGNSQAFFWN